MKLNGITCLGYELTSSNLTVRLVGCTEEQLLAIKPNTVAIMDDNDNMCCYVTGLRPTVSITKDAAVYVITFYRVYDAQAITTQQLSRENVRLSAQVTLLQQQQTFLEECILEMADEVYA